MSNLTIEPRNEPNGEGNGWHECDLKAATSFSVVLGDLETIAAFDSHDEAQSFISKRQAAE